MKKRITHNLLLWIGITVVSLLPFLIVTKQLFLRDPLIWPDEAVFVDTAKGILTTGHLATSLYGQAVPGLATRAYWYPPLYMYLLAGWIALFGPSIESVRILTLLLTGVVFILTFILCLQLFKKPWMASLGTFLLSLDSMFGWSSRIARMEMLMMAFFSSFMICFFKALERRSRRLMLAAGVISGLAVVTHPMGLLVPAISLITLLLKRYPAKQKIRDMLTITVPTLVATGMWFFTMRDAFHLFIFEYYLQLARKAPLIPYVFQLFQSFMLWRLVFIFYFILLATGIVLSVRDPKNDAKRYIAIGLGLTSAAIIWGKENMYVLYFQPYIVLIILFIYQSIYFYQAIVKKVIFTIIICITIILYIFLYRTELAAFGKSTYDYHAFVKAIQLYIPDHSRVFIVNLPDPYFDLQFNKTLTIREFPTVPVDRTAYDDLIGSSDIAIINFKPDPIVMNYIEKHATPITEVIMPNGYNTTLLLIHHPKPR